MNGSQILKECSECEVVDSSDKTTHGDFVWMNSKLSMLEMFYPQSFLIMMLHKSTLQLVKELHSLNSYVHQP